MCYSLLVKVMGSKSFQWFLLSSLAQFIRTINYIRDVFWVGCSMSILPKQLAHCLFFHSSSSFSLFQQLLRLSVGIYLPVVLFLDVSYYFWQIPTNHSLLVLPWATIKWTRFGKNDNFSILMKYATAIRHSKIKLSVIQMQELLHSSGLCITFFGHIL